MLHRPKSGPSLSEAWQVWTECISHLKKHRRNSDQTCQQAHRMEEVDRVSMHETSEMLTLTSFFFEPPFQVPLRQSRSLRNRAARGHTPSTQRRTTSSSRTCGTAGSCLSRRARLFWPLITTPLGMPWLRSWPGGLARSAVGGWTGPTPGLSNRE